MAHVFISYVAENERLAAWVAKQLRANGLDPWFSKDPGRIVPGQEWQKVLRLAIQDGGYYLPIFTRQWSERTRSVANQELMFAAEEARLRPAGRPWIVPVKADSEPLPDVELGGGRRLSEIHYVDMPQLGWERGMQSLLKALGVTQPVLEKGEPLAPGFGATALITGGFVTYRNLNVPIPELDGTSFTVTGGQVYRTSRGDIIARFRLRAPFEGLQKINEELGLESIDVRVHEPKISDDPDNPSHFSYLDKKDRRDAGMPLWVMGSREPLVTSVAIDQITGYEAAGYLNRLNQIVGNFEGFVETSSEIGRDRVTFNGEFMLQIKDSFLPD